MACWVIGAFASFGLQRDAVSGNAHKQVFGVVLAKPSERREPVRRFGLVFVVLWFLIGGIAHFAATDAEMRIVPPYIAWPREVVLWSGFFELLGAAGLLWRKTRRSAGWGLFALTVLVTPAHIYMLQRPDLFNVPYWALVLRLPVQVALLALIAWSTRVNPGRAAASSRTEFLQSRESGR